MNDWEQEFKEKLGKYFEPYNLTLCEVLGFKIQTSCSDYVKQFIKDQRKEACEDMLKYMKKENENYKRKDVFPLLWNLGYEAVIEEAKEYIKTL